MGTQSFIERRRSRRINHKSQVMFTCDTSSNIILGAETLNYNKDGVHLMCSHFPQNASEIFVAWSEKDEFPQILNKDDLECNSYGRYGEYIACYGRVVWLKKNSNAGYVSYYIGIEIKMCDVKFPSDLG